MFQDRLFPAFFAATSIALAGWPCAAGATPKATTTAATKSTTKAAPKAEPGDFTVLHAFPYLAYRSEPGPPSGPNSPLVEQEDGSLLGSTDAGGRWASGTVYRMAPDGTVNRVVDVRRGSQNAGVPMGPPVAVDRRTAIGAMFEGSGDCGFIYAVQHDHSRRVVHDFSARSAVGCLPSMLVQGDDGDLYGVADNNTIDYQYAGEIFKVSRDGQFTSLYTIKETDGSLPRWGIAKGHDGNFYGTTTGFGSYHYGGTVFRVTPAGVYTTLADIGGGANSGVIQASDGNLYGSSGDGSIYRVRPDGQIDQLASVASLHEGPTGDLIQASDGYLYGSTYASIYRISLDGQLTLIHTLDPASDGSAPVQLMQASDGFIYGSTSRGGAEGGGTLIRFRPGTPPASLTRGRAL